MSALRFSVLVLCLSIGIALVTPVTATSATFWGCYECVYRTTLTFPRDYCAHAGDGEEGYTGCSETVWGSYTFCDLIGQPCYNVEVTDGGGGGPGDDDDTCTVGLSAPCPASCQSCYRDPFTI